MGKKSPKAPDPVATANAQAEANRVSQYLPNGTSLVYGKMKDGVWTPDANNAAIKINESDYDQRLRGIGESTTMQLASMLGGGINQLPDYAAIPNVNDFGAEGKRIEDVTFKRASDLINRDFAEQGKVRENTLANRGLPMGSEAYNEEMNRAQRVRDEAISNASLDAVNAGRNEQQRLFSNAMSAGSAQNAQRSARLQELASILGGQAFTPQGAGFFGNVPQIDVAGPINQAYQGKLSAYNSQNNAVGGILGTAAGAAIGSPWFAAMMCSKDFKENGSDIDNQKILDAVKDIKVQEWNYIGEDTKHVGPYAEDWKEKLSLGDGKTISVVDAFGVLLASVQAIASKLDALESRLND